jgi:biotin carboxyl carrier protein
VEAGQRLLAIAGMKREVEVGSARAGTVESVAAVRDVGIGLGDELLVTV